MGSGCSNPAQAADECDVDSLNHGPSLNGLSDGGISLLRSLRRAAATNPRSHRNKCTTVKLLLDPRIPLALSRLQRQAGTTSAVQVVGAHVLSRRRARQGFAAARRCAFCTSAGSAMKECSHPCPQCRGQEHPKHAPIPSRSRTRTMPSADPPPVAVSQAVAATAAAAAARRGTMTDAAAQQPVQRQAALGRAARRSEFAVVVNNSSKPLLARRRTHRHLVATAASRRTSGNDDIPAATARAAARHDACRFASDEPYRTATARRSTEPSPRTSEEWTELQAIVYGKTLPQASPQTPRQRVGTLRTAISGPQSVCPSRRGATTSGDDGGAKRELLAQPQRLQGSYGLRAISSAQLGGCGSCRRRRRAAQRRWSWCSRPRFPRSVWRR